MTARTPQREHLMELLAPVITAEGYDLEDLSVTAAGRRSLIRVTVDTDGGIDLDGVADVSRAISEILDQDEEQGVGFSGPYVLEVSSPGADRPLTEPRHWRRAVGRLVATSAGDNAFTGRILAADDDIVTFDVSGAEQQHPVSALATGRVQLEFSRPGVAEPELTEAELAEDELTEDDSDSGVTVEGDDTEKEA